LTCFFHTAEVKEMARVRFISARGLILCPILALIAAWDSEPAQQSAGKSASFHNEVHQILQRKCQGCHQPAKANGKLVLTTFEHLMKGGEGGAVIEPGKPDESPLVEQISGNPPAMPKNAPPLSSKEVDLIKRWIAEGAKDDTPPAAKDPIDQDHPPTYAAPPVISALAYSPDGNTLAVSGYREVLLHKADGSSGSMPTKRLVGLSHRIESIAYSPDGKTLAVVGGQPAVFGEVQLWDAEKYKLKHSDVLAYDVLYGVNFSPDGQLIGMGCADKSARLVDVETGKQKVRIDQHDDWCFGTAFSLDGKHVVTPGRDRHLKLMESATGSFIDNVTSITPGVLGGPLYFVARHPTKNEFLTGGDDGVPKLYQMLRTKGRQIGDDFNLVRNYEKMPSRLICGAFSKDGTKLVVGGMGEARVYQFDDAKLLAKLTGQRGGVFAVSFHPNGTQVATGGFDGQVRIYDAASGSLVTSFVPVPIDSQVATIR
jgi:mono/diheme cytochrome c family protein